MASAEVSKLGRNLARDLAKFHAGIMRSGSQELKDAVIVKAVSLLVLAYGIPLGDEDTSTQEEALEKLRYALRVIAEVECEKETIQ